MSLDKEASLISNRQTELMQKARTSASFDSRQLSYIIYSGEAALKTRETILARVEATLALSDSKKLPTIYGEMSRIALYHDGLRYGKALMDEEVKHRHGAFDRATHQYNLFNASPFGLHTGMFIPTLKLQADAEQLSYWLPLAESGKIIGAYCQTELGHGSFLRGLETTATFDHNTDEFIIHSPTTTSTKYWPGGLGFSSSHAIVMARCIIGDRDYGVYSYMVQLRSLIDFRPLPGIELGDLGLKMGLNSTDNGYAIFKHVRIPRRHMMMRNVTVSREGQYTNNNSSSHGKHSYSTMVFTRNVIIHAVAFQLAQAVTIATRYSFVREQGNSSFDANKSGEIAIFGFKSQQYRLLSLMSRAYGVLFASERCEVLYQDLVARQRGGDNSTLAYAHITTAALKAYASQTAADGAEDARKCCGGHGYSALSGLPDIVANVTSIPTLEGENYVMYQQTARYLMKAASSIRRSETTDLKLAYIAEFYRTKNSGRCNAQGQDFLNPTVLCSIFRHRAARLVFDCESLLLTSQVEEGLSSEEAWNKHMMSLIITARAHIEYFVLQAFVDKVAQIQDVPVRNVLKRLCSLFALSAIESPWSIGAIGFFEDGYISSSQLREIRSRVDSLLSELAPEAIALTDAWNFSDASLQSAIGQKDGNVYETLLSWTRQIPINRANSKTNGVDTLGFQNYIRPILRSNL